MFIDTSKLINKPFNTNEELAMKAFIILFTLVAVLTGCTSPKMASIYQTQGVEIAQNAAGDDILNKYSKTIPIPNPHSSLSLCIAQELNNGPVVLTNESYFGSPWWYSYNIPNQQSITINGGQTIKLVEGNHVVANAVTDYQYNAKYFVSYTLTATRRQNNIDYLFSNIKQAQQYTGSTVNDGFENVKTLQRSHPDLVIDALNKEINKIQSCLLK